MRIITGEARGMRLEAPREGTSAIRPTPERVKEGMFSAIQFEIAGRRALDLFAGTGQLGLEAVSRGASGAVLVDRELEAVGLIRRNAEHTKLANRCTVTQYGYKEYIKSAAGREKFGLVFLDPPYRSELIAQGGETRPGPDGREISADALKRMIRAGLLEEGAIIVCESEDDYTGFTDQVNGALIEGGDGTTGRVELFRQYRYGRVFVTVLKFAGE